MVVMEIIIIVMVSDSAPCEEMRSLTGRREDYAKKTPAVKKNYTGK